MKPILNRQIIDKYILDEFGEIPNPLTKDEMKELINHDKLTLEGVKLWSLFGGDLMIKGIYGRTILHSASLMSQLDIIQYVLDKGVDVDYLDNYISTPLEYASIGGQIQVINYLLDSGANINHQDKDGWSALHFACVCNELKVVKILVERGINIHLKDGNNHTALDITKYKKHQQIIDYLIPFYNNK